MGLTGRRGHFICGTVFICLAACSPGPARPVPVYDLKLDGRSSGTALVRPGDTLGSVASRYGLTIDDLIRANGGDLVRPNQRLDLPPPRQYTVQPGDSLDIVARMFDSNVETLARANNLDWPYRVRPGQVLVIAPPSAPAPVSASDLTAAPLGAVEAQPLDAPVSNVSKTSVPRAPRPPVTPAAPSAPRYARPVAGDITSAYGPKPGGLFNDGINIAAKAGTPVKAAAFGTVAFAGDGPPAYGKMVLLKHADGYFSVYAHLSQVLVRDGAALSQGQLLGRVGATGSVREPQLHFEIRHGTKALDPAKFLR